VIISDNICIDNHHGYPHIHYSLKGEKYEIKEENPNILFEIIIENVKKNMKLNLKELKEELL
jgi:nitroimidazol reductase NimA-like FMN-containing flavoprotein (pyridoxamine 5'-phosphate oxidase superfamily)